MQPCRKIPDIRELHPFPICPQIKMRLFIGLRPKYTKRCETIDQNYHKISRSLAFLVFDPCRNKHEKLPDLYPVLKLFFQRSSQLLGQFSTDQNDFGMKMLGTQCQFCGLNCKTTSLIDFCQIATMSQNCRYKRIASFPVISANKHDSFY